MKLKYIVLISMLLSAQYCRAQKFKLLRYDEDYSTLKDSAKNFYNQIKYIPLTTSGKTYLSFGGEIREEFDRALNEDWGAANTGVDAFSLQRYSLHADLHIGDRIRVFGQLRSGLEFGRKNGPRPIDEDQLNVQNLFADVIAYKSTGRTLTLRLGRQEIQYGSGRLIDVRDGPNLRQYFDGAKMAYASSYLNVDGFIFANSAVRTGVFDNPINNKAGLWGIYSTWFAAKNMSIDLYYLGIDRPNARFDEGVADELRHTIGSRFWQNGDRLLYNVEIGYQLGTFGTSKIRAWGGSSEIGYRYSALKGAPTVKLRADFISGDNTQGDGKLGTFNALYPNGGYFGMNPQAGPANLWSVHPTLAWNPCKEVLLSMEVVFYWRQSLADGIYRPDGTFNLSSSGSAERYIGTSYITSASWIINRFLNFNVGLQYFETGSFINDVIPQHKDGFFIGSVLGFKF
ncbi:alginate export family protein [Mucilaginibacter sp. JRF]|uniref:alginate export family protein n=1 Tax=Mucilaginibacter sp. JRF TaxID=2780088 RepID=UPI00187FCEA5|nr:alginate export family protein [Mucilaginibacter sp. JRF]MBE9586205.1 alginate export family protein [Mucilaginibacter sp. JRF]